MCGRATFLILFLGLSLLAPIVYPVIVWLSYWSNENGFFLYEVLNPYSLMQDLLFLAICLSLGLIGLNMSLRYFPPLKDKPVKHKVMIHLGVTFVYVATTVTAMVLADILIAFSFGDSLL